MFWAYDSFLQVKPYQEIFQIRKSFWIEYWKINISKTKVLISGVVLEIQKSKVDPCKVCCKRVMANSLICSKCNSWIHARCVKILKVFAKLAKDFIFYKCKSIPDLTHNMQNLYDDVDTFLYLGNRLAGIEKQW